MKILKSIFASFLLLALTTAFATKGHAQTTGEIVYTSGTNFEISTGSQSTLQTEGNWGSLQALGTKTDCSGSNYLCKITYSYTLTEGQTAPSRSQIIAGIAGTYNDTNHTFGSSFVVGGVTVNFTVVQKANS